MFDIYPLLRKNIRSLKPYSSARDEFQGEASVFLDANENPFSTDVNRYPDPLQTKLKVKVSRLKDAHPHQIFLGNGSDEPIDLLIRAFCEPGVDNIVSMKPTYGMYKVCADISGVEYRDVLLNEDFSLNTQELLKNCDANTKLLFLCSPNNPTGNSLARADIIHVLDSFQGIVVLDEAYIDFSSEKGFLQELNNYPNLVILQTFSKAWGMAGMRLGMAFASLEIIAVLNQIKYPYNLNVLTQAKAIEMISDPLKKNAEVECLLKERVRLANELTKNKLVEKIYPSDANFLLVRFTNSQKLFDDLIEDGIILRNRSNVALCLNCLRITVGTEDENNTLLKELLDYSEGKKDKNDEPTSWF